MDAVLQSSATVLMVLVTQMTAIQLATCSVSLQGIVLKIAQQLMDAVLMNLFNTRQSALLKFVKQTSRG